MTDARPTFRPIIRPLEAHEFDGWARVLTNTYGEDTDGAELAAERAVLDLDRSLAAFDEDGEPVGGAAAHIRRLTVPGAELPVAGVTWVGVSPTHRRRGVLTALMRRQLDDLRARGTEPIAALRASEAGIYGRFGYGPATRGALFHADKRLLRLRPGTDLGTGTVRLLDAGRARPLVAAVYDRVRRERAGWPDRTEPFWDARLRDDAGSRGGATALRHAVHRAADGTPDGYALYRLKDDGGNSAVRVVEVTAATVPAYAALWDHLIGIDLFFRLEYEGAPDEPLVHLLTDPRVARVSTVDRLWVRLVDVGRALAARRYATPLDVVLDVQDDFCPWNAGHHRLVADGDTVSCEPTTAPADLRLSAAELGAAYLGGTTLVSLAAAGRVTELRPGALDACSTAFRGAREPFCPAGKAFPAY
ncbi:GNAT family N-acetyltransferase [Kitasatospora sp. NPDC057965]|uniref:GNAT family N-acetyltransferase n=1 Tax=Kitasatospora sp. NPDC057965 TaxID=3346291 RepID=UPI0036DF6755